MNATLLRYARLRQTIAETVLDLALLSHPDHDAHRIGSDLLAAIDLTAAISDPFAKVSETRH
jgi:hypothetical protein